jgi:NodT family efflux transporter outer membrane factor (OMF) lipoprotein
MRLPPGALFTTTLAALLAACAAAGPPAGDAMPSIDRPAARAAAGGGAGDAATVAQWWRRFDDPLLGTLVVQALQANASIAGAQASVRQARALRDAAASALWPSLTGSGSVSRNAGDAGATNAWRAGVDLNWSPDVFGGTRAAVTAGTASADASVATLGDAQVQVAAEVGLAYLALREAQQRWRLAGDSVAAQQDTLQIALWRRQAGLVTELDAAQARATLEQTRAQLPALQTAIAQSLDALAVLTGHAPGDASWAEAAALAATAPVPVAADDASPGLPAETLRQHADVRAAEYQVAAARARVAQADAQRWPSFSIGGTLGASATTLAGLGNGASVVSTLLAGVTLPLLDGGALRAQVRAQQAALDLSQSSYRATVLAALRDVNDAFVALRGDRERLLSLRAAAAAAQQADALARRQYRSGLVDFLVVLTTQRTLLSTQDAVAQASADVAADQVRLFTALGGGWRPEDGRAVPLPAGDPVPALVPRS